MVYNDNNNPSHQAPAATSWPTSGPAIWPSHCMLVRSGDGDDFFERFQSSKLGQKNPKKFGR